jgi:hypothetical protein
VLVLLIINKMGFSLLEADLRRTNANLLGITEQLLKELTAVKLKLGIIKNEIKRREEPI